MVGKDISDCTYPKSIKMKNGNSNGTLVLAIKRGEEIKVEYSKKQIIDKINSYFGYKLIGEIKLQTFNSEVGKVKNKNVLGKFSKNLQDKIDQIKNKNIKNSLSDFLNTIKK